MQGPHVVGGSGVVAAPPRTPPRPPPVGPHTNGNAGNFGSPPPLSGMRKEVDADEMRSRAAARLQALRRGEDKTSLLGSRPSFHEAQSAHSTDASLEVASSLGVAPGDGAAAFPSAMLGPNSWAWHHSPRSRGSPTVKHGPSSRDVGGGWACPLTVQYLDGDQPMLELPRLEGGLGQHVIVAAVSPEGKAYRAGVRQGHALVALNGRKEFTHLPGWQVRLLLEAPITLGFDLAPGRPAGLPPSVELRWTPSPASRPLGLSADKDVCRPANDGERVEDLWIVAEEVVFKPSGEHDEFLGAHGRTSAQVSCWQPGMASGEGVGSLGGFAGKGFRPGMTRKNRSPLRWLSPVLGHLIGESCAQDEHSNGAGASGAISPRPGRRGSPKPPHVHGDLDEVHVDLEREEDPPWRRPAR